MIYYVISVAAIITLALIGLIYLIAIFAKEREKRVEFIRRFKKGKCAIVYLAAVPLYYIGYLYAGGAPLPTAFTAVNKAMGLVVLSYDMSGVSKLMADNFVYRVAIYVCFALVSVNAILFALSFMHQKLWEWSSRLRFNWSRKEKLFIFGYNEYSLPLYCSDKKRKAIIIGNIPDKDQQMLYSKRVVFMSGEDCSERYFKMLASHLKRSGNAAITVINVLDDEKSISLCRRITEQSKAIFASNDAYSAAELLSRCRIYVFGDPEYEAVYDRLVDSSMGCIRYVNKYRCIATDFIDKYPITRFMTDEQLDFERSVLWDGVCVNMVLVGFGRTSRQLFLSSVANNQLLSLQNGEAVLSQINYHIFDRDHAEKSKNLNHSYYRYEKEFLKKLGECADDEYLPLPQIPAKEYYHHTDVNDAAFYEELRDAVCRKGSYSYIVVAFGEDLENIDIAQKLLEKKAEWGMENTYIFVRVRGDYKNYDVFNSACCYPMGDDASVYDIENIDNDRITEMAKMRNRVYALEYEICNAEKPLTEKEMQDVCSTSDCEWYTKKTQFERESNLCVCLSLRSKLHMMGLDYSLEHESDNQKGMTYEQYMAIYAKGDTPELYRDISVDGKGVVKYPLDFADSRRRTMAINEHYRWNSFMISRGFIPASKEQILSDPRKNGKDYVLRRHGNLTTFDGLLEFRKMTAERDGCDEYKKDVIKYDYQLLDDAYWLLSKNGYKITKKR